jgi:hypothetical protein
MNISEDTFVYWARPPSNSEAERCDNAETAVRKAIKAASSLTALDISVFAQGSYKVRTNIRQNSDVDICVRRNDVFFATYPPGKTQSDFDNSNSPILFGDFKTMVAKALTDYFGAPGTSRGDKAICVHANTYRIDADVVPTFEYRWYTDELDAAGDPYFHAGVAFRTDKGALIKNWPDQNYANGIARNKDSGRRYKGVIRILKRMRDKMQEDNVAAATNMASFLIENLVWNAPVDAFKNDTYTAMVRHVLASLWNHTCKDDDCNEWGEVNELKYLFRSSQPWSRNQANAFLQAAWDYAGYS